MTLRARGLREAHGFLLARTVAEGTEARRLTAYGTLYKALDRLERAGLLESRWEDPEYAAEAARPRRRFYRMTALGEATLADARRAADERAGAATRPRQTESPVH
jgi:DNA-binding PadR family transcriptional regulator